MGMRAEIIPSLRRVIVRDDSPRITLSWMVDAEVSRAAGLPVGTIVANRDSSGRKRQVPSVTETVVEGQYLHNLVRRALRYMRSAGDVPLSELIAGAPRHIARGLAIVEASAAMG